MQNASFTTNGKIWLEINDVKILGPGRVELLERIHNSGSIRQAAFQMKMSYKQAWEIIKSINAHFNQPIVISHRGGRGGKNATVTQEGHELIKQFHALQKKFIIFLKNNILSNDYLINL